ncbi:MAG: hypothetical protein IJ636_04050, partial [Bacteroidales bacterium]|nr:hypothetical protein [Bacteroidales bacterium]
MKYYKPTLGQSWWLVLLRAVGSLVGGGISLIWKDAPQSLTYLVMMVLPMAWSLWQGHLAARSGGRALAINQPHFGKLPAGVFLLLAAVALLTLSYIIEPTTSFIPMPDSIKAIFEA